MNYLPRITDKTLKETLEYIGAVLITCPKWCGKTTTVEKQAKSVINMQDPDKSRGYLMTAESKPSLLLAGGNPRLKMYPMSLFESGESCGTVSLEKLFNEKGYDIDGAKSDLFIEQ